MSKLNINEIRYNNYFIVKNYDSKYWNKIGKVKGFTKDAEYICLDINNNSAFYLKDIEPIEITENILNNSKIERLHSSCFKILKINIFCYLEKTINNEWMISIDSRKITTVKYLHQLQNVYLDLVKEELIIDL
jgi:hypothetical protein